MKNLLMLFLLLFGVNDLIAQHNLQYRSSHYYGMPLANIWGYAANNKEYALVGTFEGVSIVDVTDPDNIAELFAVPGPQSNWREIKTWGNYAYATNEKSGGLMILDLSNLPASVDTFWWTGTDSQSVNTIHTLFIDENGFLYLNGYNNLQGNIPYEKRGVLIADLNTNPTNPQISGKYDLNYVHDVYVRGDTMWTAEISAGIFSVVDVSSKSNPVLITNMVTPSNFTHNTWLSDDGNTLFTTDEKSNAFVAAYDVSDISNIKEIDRFRTNPGSGSIPHNVHVLGDHLVVAYYTDGVVIVDATKPDNLVQTGSYDTSPFMGDGFAGAWGVYPYLPSGNILVSDMQEGLFVLTPTYERAAYLEGKVRRSDNNQPLSNIRVEILGKNHYKFSDITGDYKTGTAEAGLYDVRFFRQDCPSKIVSNVSLTDGQVTVLDVEMDCWAVGVAPEAWSDFYLYSVSGKNGFTTLKYKIPSAYPGEIALFDLSGKLIFTTEAGAGEGAVTVPSQLSSGIYIATLKHREHTATVKLSVQ